MNEPFPPALVVIVTVLAALIGVLNIESGVGFIMIGYFAGGAGAAFLGFGPLFAVAGPLILALGGLDILAGIKFYHAERSSWAVVLVASTLSVFASFLQVGSAGLNFSLGSGFGIFAIIFLLMIVYSYTQPSVGFYFQSMGQRRQRVLDLENQMRQLDREYMAGKLSRDEYADQRVRLRQARN